MNGLIDLGAGLVGSYFMSKQAAQSPTLRWTVMGKEDSIYGDGRFLLGLAGVGVSLLAGDNSTAQRVGETVAQAGLFSLAAGEAYRNSAIARATAAAQGSPQPGAPPSQQVQGAPGGFGPPPMGSPAFSGGVDYVW